jgi:hypothetical protein
VGRDSADHSATGAAGAEGDRRNNPSQELPRPENAILRPVITLVVAPSPNMLPPAITSGAVACSINVPRELEEVLSLLLLKGLTHLRYTASLEAGRRAVAA